MNILSKFIEEVPVRGPIKILNRGSLVLTELVMRRLKTSELDVFAVFST